jgi:hypothetical protein
MKKKLEWNPKRAQRYMLRIAMDLIEDGMFAAEGGRLIHEAKFNGGCETHHKFVETISQVLEWDHATIGETLKEIYKCETK